MPGEGRLGLDDDDRQLQAIGTTIRTLRLGEKR
jgi:hypothetical protein